MRMRALIGFITLALGLVPTPLFAFSANKVWWESLDDGRVRIAVQYTVPALKEFRLAHAIFTQKKEADAFYWHLIQGGEFSVNGQAQLRYPTLKKEAVPW